MGEGAVGKDDLVFGVYDREAKGKTTERCGEAGLGFAEFFGTLDDFALDASFFFGQLVLSFFELGDANENEGNIYNAAAVIAAAGGADVHGFGVIIGGA